MTETPGPDHSPEAPPGSPDMPANQQFIPHGAPVPPPQQPPAYLSAQYQQPPQVVPSAYPVPAYPGFAVAPKNPAVAVLLSFFFPGVGSLVSGGTATGTIILIGWLISIPLMFVCIGFVTYLGFWIWGMFDAYSSAQKWNRAHGIIS